MAKLTQYLATATLAAAATYLFDPSSGRRRRARVRDRFVKATTRLQDTAGVAGRDLAHRSRGIAAKARSALRRNGADDGTIAERTRAALGRAVSHPGAIDVDVREGRVILTGDVLAGERESLVRKLRSVRGVNEVEDRLAEHASAEGVPTLQGGRTRAPGSGEWSPATRLVSAATGGLLVVSGLLRPRGPLPLLAAGAGGMLLARTIANTPFDRLREAVRSRGIGIRRSIYVNAPVDQVFGTLADYTSFPQFMRNVREVRVLPDGRSHWVVAGPAGVPVEWDSLTTQHERNRLLAWCTVPGSTVDHRGRIRFDAARFDGDNAVGTRLDIQMSYRPPAGALGHVVARLFGADPKSEMDEDLVRLKSFLETGRQPRDAAAQREAGQRDRPH